MTFVNLVTRLLLFMVSPSIDATEMHYCKKTFGL